MTRVKRKALAKALILTLLFSAAAGVQLAKIAKSNPMRFLPYITIKSDGTLEPQTSFIKQEGNVYTLTSDLVQNFAIKIQRSNIIFDGAGHIIHTSTYGYGNNGLSLESVTNVTVKDIKVFIFLWDISIENSNECILLRVKAMSLQLQNSSSNRIAESTIGDDHHALLMEGSNSNTVIGNNISWVGLDGYSNTFFENNFGVKPDFAYVSEGNLWDNGSVGNYWSGNIGVDANGDGISDKPYMINAEAQDRYPLMNPWDPEIPYDTVPPRISTISPMHKAYNESSVQLSFVIYEASSSMSYSLDGQDNVTVAGNTTLSEMPKGEHNITVYVTDLSGNTGASEIVYFSVEVPFPLAPVAVVSVASVAVVGVGLLVYFKKRKVGSGDET